jgi:uncharacterized protein DUF748
VKLASHLEPLLRPGRVRTAAMWAGGVLAVYAVLGFLVAPPIVRSQLERELTEQLGRTVRVERVRINPFALSASVLGFAIKEREGDSTLFAFEELYVDMTLSSLFRFAPVVEAVSLVKPSARIVRNEDMSYSFQDILDRFASRPASPPGPTPRFAVYNISLTDGAIEFDDRPSKAVQAVSDLQIGIPFISSLPSQIDIKVQPHLTAKVSGTKVELLGETKPFEDTRETKLRIDIDDLPLRKYFEYVPVPLRFRIQGGTLNTRLELALSTRKEKLATLTLSGTAGVKNFAMERSDGTPLLAVGALNVDLGALDLVNRRAAVKSVRVESPKADVIRRKDGQLNWTALTREPPKGESEDPGQPFAFSVAEFALTGGTVRVLDQAPEKPFRFALDNVSLGVTALSNEPGNKAALRLACDAGAKGKLSYDGSLALAPVRSEGALDLANLQLGAFAPYIEGVLDIIVSGGGLSTKGQLAVEVPEGAPLRVAYRADASISGFASLDQPTSQDLLRWKTLAVTGIDFQLEPRKISVDQIALSDFFSRLIVNADGTLNMQTLRKKKEGRAEGTPDSEPAKEQAKESVKEGAPAGPPPNLRFGKVVLRGGSVNFSDFFIKPNYSVALTGVEGTVSEMTPDKPGDIELRGRIHRTAPLEILGRVNSLSKDLFVDMKASVKDIDLPPVTPYSVKYTGYGIQKGKLSVKVAYHIENGKLAAENNVYLDQLTFGDRQESPTATTLPVLFAVALMKDKNGAIDIDLPISGSLDDPQFSVGGIVWTALVNLVTKAVTAPFALLGALAGGGGEELAYIEFAPGSSQLNAEEENKLKTLAKALDERPGLKLEVSGRVDPDPDRDALKRAAVEREIKTAKLKDRGEGKASSLDQVTIAPEERDKYLTAAYKEAKFDRPRTALGLLKELPPAEMEQLMLANAKVADGDLRQLANARAQTAKGWLVDTGQVAGERVFIVSPKTGSEGIKDAGRPTRADFSLK